MKRTLLAVLFATLVPLSAHAQVYIRGTIVAPGVTVHLGDTNDRGYFWDGRKWRERAWWDRYGRGRLVHYGDRDDRGNLWDGDRWRDRNWWQSHGAGRDFGNRIEVREDRREVRRDRDWDRKHAKRDERRDERHDDRRDSSRR